MSDDTADISSCDIYMHGDSTQQVLMRLAGEKRSDKTDPTTADGQILKRITHQLLWVWQETLSVFVFEERHLGGDHQRRFPGNSAGFLIKATSVS